MTIVDDLFQCVKPTLQHKKVFELYGLKGLCFSVQTPEVYIFCGLSSMSEQRFLAVILANRYHLPLAMETYCNGDARIQAGKKVSCKKLFIHIL